jgi:hypothetical protein
MWQDMKDNYRYAHSRPDSLKVLSEKKDNGNECVWALRYMDEPLTHGGKQADQDLYIKILTAYATADRDPNCRMAAVQTLGRYKDPRAAEALLTAFDNSSRIDQPELGTVLRQQVLTALGQTGNPAARELLIQVARASAKEDTHNERARTLDERLSAIRALGHFSQYDATDTLYQVMATEKDVALRDRAYRSLEEATGKNLPSDPQKWDKLLHGSEAERAAVARESSGTFSLVGWWK